MTDVHMEDANDADSGDDWDEVNDDIQNVVCLFCKEVVDSIPKALRHVEVFHDFNLATFKTKHALDVYSYIKLVNFIRRKEVSPEELNSAESKSWNSDEYLMPVLQDDAWLMLDIEEIEDSTAKPIAYPVNSENGCVTLSEAHFAELQRTIQSLKAQLEQRELACLMATQQIDVMVKKARSLVLDEEPKNSRSSSIQMHSDDGEDCSQNNTLINTDENAHLNTISKSMSMDYDDGYFRTYSHFAIHHEMLTDKVRTESYRDALLMNSNKISNCIMLDVGCGTGILSMFAAKSGCRKVISVDQSEIIYHAMDIVRENNLTDIITLKKGRLEDIEFPEEKVDAIVSEWMGYFLLFEGMLDTVIYARDHYLSPGGVLLPNRCTISIVGSGDTKRYVDLVDYWSNVYGFKMSCMKAEVVREPSIEICNAQHLITSVAEIQSFDLYTVSTDCVNFSTTFNLTVKKTGPLTAIIGYFDVFFDLDNPVHFSTGPHSPPTHWKQTVFSLSEPISITEGEILTGKLICSRHMKDIRGLIITIQIKNVSQVYHLD
ncbi:protein arginine N-methyltransferase 1 [Orussus abietinus]|uniref:protein arginine N-methyltransferase 1 n=1 Tax=Orussus abietinus TaxID=222816 RepID=UPI000624FF31|nr:protein arginine N-methyltransferase 1 [Orussus abietinus]